MNQVNLMGRLTKDPELKYSQSGNPYCRFTIAVDDGRDANGNSQTLFIDCMAHKKLAENLSRYQTKGSLIVVTGKINVNEWQKDDGTTVRAYQVMAFNIHYTGKAESKPTSNVKESYRFDSTINISDDCLPF